MPSRLLARAVAPWFLTALLFVSVPSLASQPPPPIEGTVFFDVDGNGLQDPNDRGLPGTTVSLLRNDEAEGVIVQSVTTGADGAFNLQPDRWGPHTLSVLLPEGYVFALPGEGDIRVLPASGRSTVTPQFTLSPQQPPSPLSIGAIKRASYINVVAFGDDNANGGRFSSEPLLRNVQVDLLYERDGETHVIASRSTDREGYATFRELSPGVYRVAATLPEPYIVGPLGIKLNTFYNCIQPSDSAYGVSDPFMLPYAGSVGLGIGGVETGSASGLLWADSNMNGILDPGEPSFSQAELTLTNDALGVRRSLLPDPDGRFSFTALQGGSYVLSVSLPNDTMFTLPGGDSLLSEGASREQSAVIRIATKEVTQVGSIGVIPVTSLVVRAFHDSNVNGLWDEGEPVFTGAEVEVLKDGVVVASAVSDRNGDALIPILRGGAMTIRCSLPDLQVFSPGGGEGGNAFFSQAAASSLALDYTLPHGTQGELLAGVTLPSAITGVLFEDANISGARDADERMLPGFRVSAVALDGTAVAEAVTDADGRYLLSGLVPGSYTVRVGLESPFVVAPFSGSGSHEANRLTSQTPEHGETDLLHLSPGQTMDGVDGALFRSSVIEGAILIGNDSDGFSGNLGGLKDVFVELLDEDEAPVSDYTIARTDAEGRFFLKGALPGVYSLSYTLPEDVSFSKPLTDAPTIQSEPFTVGSSDEITAPTLFAEYTGTISGSVFLDMDSNGLSTDGEPPLDGVSLVMESEEGRGVVETRSDPDGNYQLHGLRPGTYTLTVIAPEGTLLAHSETSPVPPTASNMSKALVEVTMGMSLTDRQIAVVPTAALTGTVYFDDNLDSLFTVGEAVRPGTELRFRHRLSGIEFLTAPSQDGSYDIPSLFPGAYTLSAELPEDYVLYSPTGSRSSASRWSADLRVPAGSSGLDVGLVQLASLSGAVWNLDGSLEGVEGLVVRLHQGGETSTFMESLTDADGAFGFDGLYPGRYALSLELPQEYRFARPMDTGLRPSVITSEGARAAGNQGRSDEFVLGMGEKRFAADVGIGSMGRLGDCAWLDLDGDGMQDTGEPGVPGLVIRLIQHDTVVAETITDRYGRYLFDELYPGIYTVEVTMHPELKPTLQQTAYPLVASVLSEADGVIARAENIIVPSGSYNFNCDFGFVAVTQGVLPEVMRDLPQKDWTPYVDVVPSR